MLNKNIKKLLFYSLFLFILLSCKQIDTLNKTVFNTNQLINITINAENKKIINLYEPQYINPYIDHSLLKTPKDFLYEWFESNINVFGTENNLEINIIDASLKRTEIPNLTEKKHIEKIIFFYEVSFLVEYILYDDSNLILANSIVDSKRSITSSRRISLNQSESIINSLIINCIIDLSKKSEDLINIYMSKFIL